MSQTQVVSGEPPVRASDAERGQATEILRAGYAEGRLSRAELDERLGAAYAAKTRADLRDLTSDLPGATSAPTARDLSVTATVPLVDTESGTGMGPDRCLLLCLLFAFPPAGIIYWILTTRNWPSRTGPGPAPGPTTTADQVPEPAAPGAGDRVRREIGVDVSPAF